MWLNHERSILLEKTDNGEYKTAVIKSLYNYPSKRYTINKSYFSFKPELKDGSINLPSVNGQVVGNLSREDIDKMEFFTLSVVTEGGKHIRVGGYGNK